MRAEFLSFCIDRRLANQREDWIDPGQSIERRKKFWTQPIRTYRAIRQRKINIIIERRSAHSTLLTEARLYVRCFGVLDHDRRFFEQRHSEVTGGKAQESRIGRLRLYGCPVCLIILSASIRARLACSGLSGSSRSVVAVKRRPPSRVRSVRISGGSSRPAVSSL